VLDRGSPASPRLIRTAANRRDVSKTLQKRPKRRTVWLATSFCSDAGLRPWCRPEARPSLGSASTDPVPSLQTR
jgi:hypothetical protein